MPRAARLHDSRDFARIYRHGRTTRGKLLRLTWQPSRTQQARVAVVTNRKLSTKAVRRNELKRTVRGIVRELLPTLEPIDLILQILPQPLSAFSAQGFRAELAALLAQQHLTRSTRS